MAERWPYFKVYDDRINDAKFVGMTNAEWGIYHKLECLAACQDPRWKITYFPTTKFLQLLSSCTKVVENRLDKILTKFKERELIDYDIDEGWIHLIYTESKQEPLSDAERAKRYRQRQASRNRHVKEKKRKEYKREEKVTPLMGEEQIENWIEFAKEIVSTNDNAGLASILDKQLQTTTKEARDRFYKRIREEKLEEALIQKITRARGKIIPLPG